MQEEYRNKKSSLVVFGIVEILGGLCCALLTAIALIPLIVSPNDSSIPQIVPGLLVYIFLSIWLIWMAIGTIRARRWARTLMLAGSWLMLAYGILAMGVIFFILPKCYASLEIPNEMTSALLIGTYVFMAVIYLLFPTIGILFYGNRNVRATIEHSDPGPSWTDCYPLPVLVLVMMLAMAAASMLMMSFMNFTMPFFGILVTGWQGAIVLFCCFSICVALAFGAHRLRSVAWWGVLGVLSLGLVSQLITFSRIDLMDFYEVMGYSDQMMQQMRDMNWMDAPMFVAMSLTYAVPTLIYLLLIKRYFEK